MIEYVRKERYNGGVVEVSLRPGLDLRLNHNAHGQEAEMQPRDNVLAWQLKAVKTARSSRAPHPDRAAFKSTRLISLHTYLAQKL